MLLAAKCLSGASFLAPLFFFGSFFTIFIPPAQAILIVDSFEDDHSIKFRPRFLGSLKEEEEDFVDEVNGIIIGGERDVRVRRPNEGALTYEVSNSLLKFEETLADGGTAELQYDGNDDNILFDTTGLGQNNDVTQLGINEGIAFIGFESTGDIDIRLELYSDSSNGDNNFSALDLSGTTINNLRSIYQGGIPFFAFDDFQETENNGATFTNITAIKLEITVTGIGNVAIDDIQFQEEPEQVPWNTHSNMGFLALLGFLGIRFFRNNRGDDKTNLN